MANEAVPRTLEAAEEQVLAVVRALAQEVGGGRAARAVKPGASLDRDIGIGSLEKVELIARLEAAFGRSFDDRDLALDPPRESARFLVGAPPEPSAPPAGADAGRLAPATPAAPVRTIHESLWSRAEEQPLRPHVYLREDDG